MRKSVHSHAYNQTTANILILERVCCATDYFNILKMFVIVTLSTEYSKYRFGVHTGC